MSAIAGGAAIGAGVGLSSVALMPFNAANTFLGSAFFGYGMILGERYMYQADWPKIQQRLENGEKIENIIQEYTGTFTAVVMKEAKIIFDSVSAEMAEIIKDALGLGAPTVGSTTLDVTVEPSPTSDTDPAPVPIVDTGEHTHYVQGKGVVPHSEAHATWTSSFQLPLKNNLFKISIYLAGKWQLVTVSYALTLAFHTARLFVSMGAIRFQQVYPIYFARWEMFNKLYPHIQKQGMIDYKASI